MSAKPVKESLVEGRGAQVPLKKGGKGRRPWGLSWQIREPEVRRPPRGFSETAVPLSKGGLVRPARFGVSNDDDGAL